MSTTAHCVSMIDLDLNRDRVLNYYTWNKLIAEHFFNSEKSDQSVYLYVTKPLLDELGKPSQADHQDFIRAVLQGPDDISDDRLNLCGKARKLYRRWDKSDREHRSCNFPPYIACLALFVLATHEEVDASEHSYYPGLNKLIGRHESDGGLAGFKDMWELWQDLEDWTTTYRDGEYGIFTFQILGAHFHVGLPKSQTILTDSDRNNLPKLFAKYSLDPNNPPSDSYLYDRAQHEARRLFLRPTQRRLQQGGKTGDTLKAVLASELRFWDGTYDSDEPGQVNTSNRFSLSLRLCCRLDSNARVAQLSLRCKSTRDYPEAGLRLRTDNASLTLTGRDHLYGWSQPLYREGQDAPFDPCELTWCDTVVLREVTTDWTARLHLNKIHMFEAGHRDGISDYVETNRLKTNTDHLLLVRDNVEEIAAGCEQECEHCTYFSELPGLPEGWYLLQIKNIKEGKLLKELDLRLDMQSPLSVGFAGGIRATEGSGNTYFNFAKPHLEVTGSPEAIRPDVLMVKCAEEILMPSLKGGLKYYLPKNLPVDSNLSIEIDDSSQPDLNRIRKFRLVVPTFTDDLADVAFDRFGDLAESGSGGSLGADVQSDDIPEFTNSYKSLLEKYSTSTCHLLGRSPGQCTSWDATNPPDWEPIWIVIKSRNNFTIVPCMTNLDTAQPCAESSGSVDQIKQWKRFIQINPKKRKMPMFPAHAKLWQKYGEVAKNA